MTRNGEDCRFFMMSTCMKGGLCPFRHSEAAKTATEVCEDWEFGRCFTGDCGKWHNDFLKDRAKVRCYYESTPGGCLKPHCPFFHARDKPQAPTLAPPAPASTVPATGDAHATACEMGVPVSTAETEKAPIKVAQKSDSAAPTAVTAAAPATMAGGAPSTQSPALKPALARLQQPLDDVQLAPASEFRVRTFEEIMEDKRKAKAQQQQQPAQPAPATAAPPPATAAPPPATAAPAPASAPALAQSSVAIGKKPAAQNATAAPAAKSIGKAPAAPAVIVADPPASAEGKRPSLNGAEMQQLLLAKLRSEQDKLKKAAPVAPVAHAAVPVAAQPPASETTANKRESPAKARLQAQNAADADAPSAVDAGGVGGAVRGKRQASAEPPEGQPAAQRPKTAVVAAVKSSAGGAEVKIKSFEEIMEEKRREKEAKAKDAAATKDGNAAPAQKAPPKPRVLGRPGENAATAQAAPADPPPKLTAPNPAAAPAVAAAPANTKPQSAQATHASPVKVPQPVVAPSSPAKPAPKAPVAVAAPAPTLAPTPAVQNPPPARPFAAQVAAAPQSKGPQANAVAAPKPAPAAAVVQSPVKPAAAPSGNGTAASAASTAKRPLADADKPAGAPAPKKPRPSEDIDVGALIDDSALDDDLESFDREIRAKVSATGTGAAAAASTADDDFEKELAMMEELLD